MLYKNEIIDDLKHFYGEVQPEKEWNLSVDTILQVRMSTSSFLSLLLILENFSYLIILNIHSYEM